MQGTPIHRLWGALMPVAILSLTVTADASLVAQAMSLSKSDRHTSQDAIPSSLVAHTNQDGDGRRNRPHSAVFEDPIPLHDDVELKLAGETLSNPLDAPVPELFDLPLAFDAAELRAIDDLIGELDAASLDAASWFQPPPASGTVLPPLMPEMSQPVLSAPADGMGPIIAQPIPVPGAMTVLGLGLAGALARRRRHV